VCYNDSMKKVLITGGAGFIGSHLGEKFLDLNYKVICVDNLITGQKKNINHFIKNPNFKFIQADVTKKSSYSLLPTGYSLILHFASPAGPNPYSTKSYMQYPIKTYLVNSIGTHCLLELAKQNKAEFVFASSSEIYGDPKEHPQKETYVGHVNNLGPRACYDESKRFGEMATMTFAKKYNLKAKIIRIFNTYGPRMNPDDGRVIPQFILQSLKKQPLTIHGKGQQTRSFCYIDDLIKGIIKIVDKGKSCEVYNLGNDQELTILKLAEKIKQLTQSKSRLVFKPLPLDDPEKRKPDLSKIKKELHWQPETSLEEGLKKTISYFKNV